ncbi:MAG TPA: zinc-binding dehydrogenase [Dehalococcoidia bacterium]|nr:zinc-binding dehydrogenase [Dehalococcoidia bacterium]
MKAAIFEGVGRPLAVEDIPRPQPRQGEVLIKVAACGVCHSDLHVIKGELPYATPTVLGHEMSGVVVEVAPDVTSVKPGDHVVSTFILPCNKCAECYRGRDDLCENFFAVHRAKGVFYDGETRLHRGDGAPLAMYSMSGLAEYSVAPATAVFPIPAEVALHQACILGCAVPTAYSAVKHQGEIEPGMTVAVIGAGGVGSNIIQVAHAFGAAEIIAVDIREEKLAAARRLGATQGVNGAEGDPAAQIRALTGGKGVDVAFEALGRPDTVITAFDAVRDGGKVVVVGLAPTSVAASIEITRLVRRSVTMRGSFGARMRSDVPELVKLVARGEVSTEQLVTQRFSLEQAGEAYAALSRGEITGRAMVVIDEAL